MKQNKDKNKQSQAKTAATNTYEQSPGYTGDKKLGGPNRPAE